MKKLRLKIYEHYLVGYTQKTRRHTPNAAATTTIVGAPVQGRRDRVVAWLEGKNRNRNQNRFYNNNENENNTPDAHACRHQRIVQ